MSTRIPHCVRPATAAALAAVSLGGLCAAAGPAHAQSSESIKVAGATASFIANGNGLAIRDTRRDGWCARALATWIDGSDPANPHEESTRLTVCGKGHGKLRRLPIGEGTGVLIRACRVFKPNIPTAPQRCSQPQHGVS